MYEVLYHNTCTQISHSYQHRHASAADLRADDVTDCRADERRRRLDAAAALMLTRRVRTEAAAVAVGACARARVRTVGAASAVAGVAVVTSVEQ